jgi:hypothetical protein
MVVVKWIAPVAAAGVLLAGGLAEFTSSRSAPHAAARQTSAIRFLREAERRPGFIKAAFACMPGKPQQPSVNLSGGIQVILFLPNPQTNLVVDCIRKRLARSR